MFCMECYKYTADTDYKQCSDCDIDDYLLCSAVCAHNHIDRGKCRLTAQLHKLPNRVTTKTMDQVDHLLERYTKHKESPTLICMICNTGHSTLYRTPNAIVCALCYKGDVKLALRRS